MITLTCDANPASTATHSARDLQRANCTTPPCVSICSMFWEAMSPRPGPTPTTSNRKWIISKACWRSGMTGSRRFQTRNSQLDGHADDAGNWVSDISEPTRRIVLGKCLTASNNQALCAIPTSAMIWTTMLSQCRHLHRQVCRSANRIIGQSSLDD